MKLLVTGITAFVIFAQSAYSGSVAKIKERKQTKQQAAEQEKLVFVTGSLIPQRVHLRSVTSDTMSPLRIIDRREIDQTGRMTTAGALINEPSLNIISR